MSDSRDHIAALTSLRFVAAMAVVLFHSGGPGLTHSGALPTPLVNLLGNGYLGVPFFFVLSGFILTHVYQGRLATGDQTRRYTVARLARVYPVYLLALVLTAIWVPFEDWSLASFPQFVMLQSWTPAWPGGAWFENWNIAAWTLSIELVFYLTFPWLLAALDRLSIPALWRIVVVLCGLLVVFRLPGIVRDQDLPYDWMRPIPMPILRYPEFALGVSLGLLSRRDAIPSRPGLLYAAMIATVMLLAASLSRWVAPVACILFAVVIALAPGSVGNGVAGRILKSRPFVLLGEASYSLFLLQMPINILCKQVLGQTAGRYLFLPVLLALSILVFKYFEEPLREAIRGRFRVQPKPAMMA